MDLATEETRDLSANREPEAGPTVFAARRAIGLLERLEDQLLLLPRDADARVLDAECDDLLGPVERPRREATPFVRPPDGEGDRTTLRELERVR